MHQCPTLIPQPFFREDFHYCCDSSIPFEETLRKERCYINLERESVCPMCSNHRTRLLAVGVPVRSEVHFWKLIGYVYLCGLCKHAYVLAEVID